MIKTRLIRLIIVFLAGLIALLLPYLVGYSHLSAAEAAPNCLQASLEYEAATHWLFWRADLYEQAGLAALEGEDAQRAIALFEMARQKGALTATGRLKLAQAYFATGATERAVDEWEALLNDGQAGAEASQALAQLYFQQNQFSKAEEFLLQWLEFAPQNAEASYRLGLLRMAEASPEALPLLKTAATDPALAARATDLLSALEVAATETAPVYRLTVCGRALAATGEWLLAEQAFLRATEVEPAYAPAWAWLGEARQQTGHGHALAALQRAVALAPQSAEMRVMLALYWQRRNNWPNARAEYEIAARLDSRNPLWQMALGEMSVHLGNLVEALDYYQKATQLAPADASTWRGLALFCVENDAYVETVGLEAARQAYALEPASVQNMDALARALLATGEADSAEALFKQAIAAAPSDPVPVFHLGLLYLQTKQSSLARENLLAAQQLAGSGPLGEQIQKVLERYFP